MKKFILLSIFSLVVFCNFAFSQAKKMRWESEGGMCEYEGTFDAKKYSAIQLKNTQRLLNSDFSLDLTTATVWKYEEISSLNFAPIEADYKKKSTELKNLEIVKSPYWEARRQQKLKELEQYYWLITSLPA